MKYEPSLFSKFALLRTTQRQISQTTCWEIPGRHHRSDESLNKLYHELNWPAAYGGLSEMFQCNSGSEYLVKRTKIKNFNDSPMSV
jgi:hypothetical protein